MLIDFIIQIGYFRKTSGPSTTRKSIDGMSQYTGCLSDSKIKNLYKHCQMFRFQDAVCFNFYFI